MARPQGSAEGGRRRLSRPASVVVVFALVVVIAATCLTAVRASTGADPGGTDTTQVPPSTTAPSTGDQPTSTPTTTAPVPETTPAASAPAGPDPQPATTVLQPGNGSAPTTPIPDGKRVLWSTGMDDGTLTDWYAPETAAVGDFGGGPFDSGGGITSATTELAHSGAWSAKLALPTGAGGARLFRWRELLAERDTTQRVWLFIPRAYRLTGNPVNGHFWDIAQFKSRSEDGQHNDPLWFLNVTNSRNRLGLQLIWWDNTLEGPHTNEFGYRVIGKRGAQLPVGRWFQLRLRLRQSSEFDGILQVWIDARRVYNLRNVRTSYRNCTVNSWCADTAWSVNNYSDGLAPAPAVVYADDVSIERTVG
jgi:hypothetical protein